MIERHSKVFVPVSAEKKYPDNENDYYFTIDSVERKSVVSGYDLYYNKIAKDTHWLEEKENVYVLSEQEYDDIKKESIALLRWLNRPDAKYAPLFDNETFAGNEDDISIEDFYELFNQQK
jgi:hypothetical protein